MADIKEGVEEGSVKVDMIKEPLTQGDTGVDEVDFAKITLDDAFKYLNCNKHGLSSAEAAARLQQHGPNKLPDSSRNPVLVFLGYMWNPLAWAMEAAAIISIALLDVADFVLIVGLLLINAIISFYEESNADKAIKALTAALAPKAMVVRDGAIVTIDAVNLVPGDVILIRLGNIVPADVKLLEEEGADEGEQEAPMQIDQAALTGESLPAKKFTGDVAFSGSSIKQGERHAVVYATGVNTFFGRAAALISGTNNVSNLQTVMNKMSAICIVTILLWVVVELAVQFGHYSHECVGGREGCPTLLNMLVVLVGGIPIAMPTVLSVTLALGAYKLAREGAIVTRMSAVEEMAGMDVLCSDKTGTLTLNKLSIDKSMVVPVGNMGVDEIMRMGALSANTVTEEPIDMVLWESYPDRETIKRDYKHTKYFPFNPNDKITIATCLEIATGRVFRVLKGSPQVVLAKAWNAAELDATVNQKMVEFANRGFRALGLAMADGDGKDGTKWEMLALLPLFDPPRHDTKETIEHCQNQGIQVKMITGDHLLIGKETAKMLGMGTEMFPSEVMIKARNGDASQLHGYKNFVEMVETCNGFAQVFPEHKFEIVKILQDSNHVVGMTGDGVNDAPALKKADVGVAVADATDAARGAADIVLTEPGLSTIVTAVIGARKIFQRMTTYSKYTIAMTFRICFTFGLITVIYDWYFPTILIVIMAVFNDGAMIALSKDRVVASKTPNSWNITNIFIMGMVYGLYLTLSTWALYQTATKTTFFEDKTPLHSLNDQYSVLQPWCEDEVRAKLGQTVDPYASLCESNSYAKQFDECEGYQKGSGVQVEDVPTLHAQCVTEQRYLRGAMTRSLIYTQVSISGQALVFVVRTAGYSLMERAGTSTYLAFFFAQVGATLFGIFGLGGFEKPRHQLEDCQFCDYSFHEPVDWFDSGIVPESGTESDFTASVIGCGGYVIVAWIWSAIWYVLLDPIKWILFWILNEEGFRDTMSWRESTKRSLDRRSKDDIGDKEFTGPSGMVPANYSNPLGRASMSKPVSAVLDRKSASLVAINRNSMTVSQDPNRALNIGRRSMIGRPSGPVGRTSMPLGRISRTSNTLSTGSKDGQIGRGSKPLNSSSAEIKPDKYDFASTIRE
uniref:Plasma membrane ATPase n=1 Tax=Dunaliella maritima TaxID=289300 RepID=A0A5B9Y1F6_9CHLO|nr:H+-translocating ATPase P-type [Dunaliella maritima]